MKQETKNKIRGLANAARGLMSNKLRDGKGSISAEFSTTARVIDGEHMSRWSSLIPRLCCLQHDEDTDSAHLEQILKAVILEVTTLTNDQLTRLMFTPDSLATILKDADLADMMRIDPQMLDDIHDLSGPQLYSWTEHGGENITAVREALRKVIAESKAVREVENPSFATLVQTVKDNFLKSCTGPPGSDKQIASGA